MASKLDAVFERISENTIVKAIRQGLLFIMPIIMVGSFVLMVLNLPIEWINNLLNTLFGENWRTFGLAIHRGTFRIMSLSALIAISYALAKDHALVKAGKLNPIFIILTALSCHVTYNPGTESVVDENATGPTGMFGAIVIAIISTYVFLFFFRHMPKKMKTYAYDADTILLSSLFNVLPVLLTIASFSLVRLIYDQLGLSAAFAAFSQNLNESLLHSNNGILTALLYDLITHIMWFFGIHGTNVMESFAQNVFVSASNINIGLMAAGQAPTQVLTKEFFDIFVFLGGAGCTLGLLIALFFAGRASNTNSLAKYSLWPGLFNINEAMVYGLPIIFNPYYLAPFLLTPVALSITSYIAFATGLVPLTTSSVVWTTPIFISGYISTGSVAGVILQAVNLVLAAAIYLPFVRLYEKQIARNNIRIFKQLSTEYNTAQPENPPQMLGRNDELGMIARTIATELRAALTDEAKGLHMEFQPKSHGDATVFGAEALIRWKHPVYGFISPLVILGVGDEAGMTVELGDWIMKKSFSQLRVWRDHQLDLSLSVNLSPKQLKEDDRLVERITGIMEQYALDPAGMELELTEHAALDQSPGTRNRLELLKNMGLSIAIDDFGMGNSSLLYLRDFYANVVKLDISLVRTINENTQSQEIVRSIVSLCTQLDAGIVAEGVETLEQMLMLQELGCDQFQGWYFCKSLPPAEFLAYVEKHGTAPHGSLE